MRRETRDELLLGFLAINAMLREEVRTLKHTLRAHASEAKYNPNWARQPRAPRGTGQGGQWIGNEGGKVSELARPQPAELPEQRPQMPQRQRTQRLPNAANDNAPTTANDTLVRLSLTRGR